jgi:hypothetical protein
MITRFSCGSSADEQQFLYDAAVWHVKPFREDSSFGKKISYQCHTIVKAKGYTFTGYPLR